MARDRPRVPRRLPGGGADAGRARRLAARPDARRDRALPLERSRRSTGVELVPPRGHPGRAARDRLSRRGLVPARPCRGWHASASVDVLHCPTFRGPLRPPPCPLVVTVHDLAVLRHPEAFNPWTRLVQPPLRPSRRAGGEAGDRRLRVHEARARRAARRAGGQDRASSRTGSTSVFSPDGPAAEGDYVLAVGTLEPRKNLARVAEAAATARDRAPRRRRAGLGRASTSRRAGSAACSDDELARALPRRALPRLPVALRGLRPPDRRGDGVRRAGRDEPWRGDGGDRRRRGRARRPASTSPRSRAGSRRRWRGAPSCAVSASTRAQAFSWDETARATVEVYREVAA